MVLRFFAALIVLVFIPGWALAQEHVATAKTPQGSVTVVRDGETSPVEAGARLFKGDVIRTGSDSSVGIMFLDGTRLGVGAGTECRIDHYIFDPLEDRYAFDVYMKRGSAVYSSGKIGMLKPNAIKIRTPRATVGVRGTRFLINVE
ncbi:hypothetical protein DPQ33_03870 [Oceanidesulfovibrio indonesiensis]|uniref:FecR protein domain-containing protein n=1 Tax=Oceanidesulfovibrio indonesiensis TaxID=54767 RepID=A0A7M3MJC1_9BACT|nr:FecR domain-containing protein [Oceanidesulfovibrio indonesiensis]TVM19505.1 hypothetical protein DPQ33_03870 [Oceanidesulfovibrio indonesiensis]